MDDQSRLEELQVRYANNALLSAPGFKQFFDGVSSEHTAYLTEPYTNPRFPGDQGRLTVPAERMRKLVLAAAERGHTVRIHVIGDGAIHAALDIFEEAADLYGLPQHGHNTLEHLENLLPEDIDRLRKLNVVASSQPCHITLDPGGPERDLGLERSRIMWPFATYKQRGIRQAFGTDSPITSVTSMNVLYTAITRQDPKSHWPEGGWLPSERIDAATALRNYTLGSAYAAGDEQNLGSLEPGKYADLVVLDQNPLTHRPPRAASHQGSGHLPGGQLNLRALTSYPTHKGHVFSNVSLSYSHHPHRHFAALTFLNAGSELVNLAPVWLREGGHKVYREFRTSRRPLNVAFVRAGLPEQETLCPAPPEPHGSHC